MKKMKRGFLLGILAACLLFSGCDAIANAAGGSSNNNSNITTKEKVYNNAMKYVNSNTSYQANSSGGIGSVTGSYAFDNVGFITRCYEDALSYGYKLPYNYKDGKPTVYELYSSYSLELTSSPERGDLVFFTKENSRYVGIFVAARGNIVEVITAIDEKNWNEPNKKVVARRQISKDSQSVEYRIMDVKNK